MLAGEGLKPSSQGRRAAFDGARRTVIDGLFAATRELVAGFWLREVKDMEAVANAIAFGPAAGLALLDAIEQAGVLRGCAPLPAARGDFVVTSW